VLLEMRDATFRRGGEELVSAQNVALEEGDRLAHACADNRAAAIVAMMAAGLVRASGGAVYVGAFDPRIQPVHVKRLAGYVPHDALPYEFPSFEQYIEYRAALWQLPQAESVVRGRHILSGLDGIHETFAYPLAGALIAQPRLLVLDRPQAVYGAQIVEVAKTCAIFSTHGSENEAARFSDACMVRV
jgi:ABC-type Na+ transport system ATPase subunit NatA